MLFNFMQLHACAFMNSVFYLQRLALIGLEQSITEKRSEYALKIKSGKLDPEHSFVLSNLIFYLTKIS